MHARGRRGGGAGKDNDDVGKDNGDGMKMAQGQGKEEMVTAVGVED